MRHLLSIYNQLNVSERMYLLYSMTFGMALFVLTILFIIIQPFQIIVLAFYEEQGDRVDQQELLVSKDFSKDSEKDADVLAEADFSGHALSLQSDIEVELFTEPTPIPPPADCSANTLIGKIDTEEKIVVFTFDADGLANGTNEILNAFDSRALKTTFFVSGSWASRYPEMIRAISAGGHEIFNHSMTHPNFKTISDSGIRLEVESVDKIVSEITGKSTTPFFRPPYGAKDARVIRTVCESGYYTVIWNIDGNDWREKKGITVDQVRANVIDNLKPGGIILMHTGNNITGSLIDQILNETIARGYEPMQLSEAYRSY